MRVNHNQIMDLHVMRLPAMQSVAIASDGPYNPQQQSILSQFPSSELTYGILQFLYDMDALRCIRTCKLLYSNILPKYDLKQQIDIDGHLFIYDPIDQTYLRLDSTRPIPGVTRFRCMNIDDLSRLDRIKVNKNRMKSLHHVFVKPGFDFTKLPQSLTELNLRNVAAKIMPIVRHPFNTSGCIQHKIRTILE